MTREDFILLMIMAFGLGLTLGILIHIVSTDLGCSHPTS